MTVSQRPGLSVDVVDYDCVASVCGQMVGEEGVMNVGIQGFVQANRAVEQKILPRCRPLVLGSVAEPIAGQSSSSDRDDGDYNQDPLGRPRILSSHPHRCRTSHCHHFTCLAAPNTAVSDDQVTRTSETRLIASTISTALSTMATMSRLPPVTQAERRNKV